MGRTLELDHKEPQYLYRARDFYAKVINRFGDDTDPRVKQQVSQAWIYGADSEIDEDDDWREPYWDVR